MGGIKTIALTAALLCSVSVSALAANFDLTPVVGPAGPQITADFQRLFTSRSSVTGTDLAPYKILFIPGFTADYLDGTVGYFREARRELKRLGLREGADFEFIIDQHNFSGERTMAENAVALAAILRESTRPVLAITHSKGAVDLLETLLVYPDTRAKLKGWISYQGANGGSILADAASKGWTRPFMSIFLHTYGGTIEALEDLRQPVRVAYLQKNLPAIQQLMKEVNVVSVVTQEDYRNLSIKLRTVANMFDPDREKSQSDGMIAIKNSMLAYSPFVFLTGVSHENLCETGNYDRVQLTHASLKLLLSRISGTTAE